MIHWNDSRCLRHIGKPATTDIPKQQYPVTHRDRNIRQPIIVEVFEAGAPAEVLQRDFAETGYRSNVRELRLSEILIERIRIICEVRDEDIEQAVAVVVADSDTHSGLSRSQAP